MRVAVVGHVEWVHFARVARLPAPGEIVHATQTWEEAAGGGAVAAVQLANLGAEATLVTALGDDELGERAREQLARQRVGLDVQTRDEPTRRAFTFVDAAGERTITVLGDKLRAHGPLPQLASFDAVYFVSGDAAALESSRAVPLLVATARELPTLREAHVRVDVLVGSAEDESERYGNGELEPPPKLVVRTEGAAGGSLEPGGRYDAAPLAGPVSDAYGCGDCFAAALTFALARGDDPAAAAAFAARAGAAVLTGRGPYEVQLMG